METPGWKTPQKPRKCPRHSAEGLKPRNQYAKRAIDLRCADRAPKSFKCKTLRSARATATPEYSRLDRADRRYAAWWDSEGLPFVQGPNMLFTHSGSPRIDAEECALLDAANCRAMFCHTEWYADLIRKHRGPANQSPIILWPYPIDPWPGEALPDEYDLLIYAKNGHRPQLLEHLAEVFPRHIQIHYGQYQREELFEAARRSRACAYLADDDHGPLALQEILLAGYPTVGVRTGASFVRTGETGVIIDRLPPGRQCAESDDDVRALAVFMEAIEQAQAMDRQSVRDRAAWQFDTDRIMDSIITAVNKETASV